MLEPTYFTKQVEVVLKMWRNLIFIQSRTEWGHTTYVLARTVRTRVAATVGRTIPGTISAARAMSATSPMVHLPDAADLQLTGLMCLY